MDGPAAPRQYIMMSAGGGNEFHGSQFGTVTSNSSTYAGWDIDALLASLDDDLLAVGTPPTFADRNRSFNATVAGAELPLSSKASQLRSLPTVASTAALSSDSFDLDRLIEELSCESKPSYTCVRLLSSW